jgi:antirestriction protein ArdC
MNNNKVINAIVSGIITELENGEIPVWRKTWSAVHPQNVASKSQYRGINTFLTQADTLRNGYTYPLYISVKQCRDSKGKFRLKKEALRKKLYCPIVKWIVYTHDKDGNELEKKRFSCRYYQLYNIDLLETGRELVLPKLKENNSIDDIDMSIAPYTDTLAGIEHAFNAWYAPVRDIVGIPNLNEFDSSQAYYETLFHELAHSTGHASRLKRDLATKTDKYNYSIEELTAEIAASMLCSEFGLQRTDKRDIAYIQSWLKVLKDDKSILVIAAQRAQHAVDMIMQRQPKYEDKQPLTAQEING